MIQKSVFERKINESNKIQRCQDNIISIDMKKSKLLQDISNSFEKPQVSMNCLDFKSLYQSEVQLNEQLRMKIQVLQQKVRLLQEKNRQLRKNQAQKSIDESKVSLTILPPVKKSKKQIFFQELGSYKQNLPNSMKVIELQDLNQFQSLNSLNDSQIITNNHLTNSPFHQQTNINMNPKVNGEKHKTQQSASMKIINDQSLIDCLTLYGLSEEPQFNQQDQEFFLQPQITYCSKNPHQIVKHTANLVYPQKIKESDMRYYKDEEATKNAVSLISENLKSELKAFTLIFEPAIMQDQEDLHDFNNDEKQEVEIIDLVNKQRRFYAICISFEDFDVIQQNLPQIEFDNSLQEDIYKRLYLQALQAQNKNQENLNQIENNRKSVDKQKKQFVFNQKEQNFNIRVSRKVLALFTKYPFISFFQQILVNCLKESFQLRRQAMRKDLSKLKRFEHLKTKEFIKIFYTSLEKQFGLGHQFESKINEIFEIRFMSARNNKLQRIQLQLSRSQLRNYYSSNWAYHILRLFTLDNFLDTLTSILLEEKVVFVCQNEHILTCAVFLFAKVLIQPFKYPYPLVSIIPNQYDYFNAPFPIVYGCLNSKENLIKLKIPKLYQNVYIVLNPHGIEIISQKNYSSKIQALKSPKLRDKLLSLFIKIQNTQKLNNPQKPSNQTRFSGITSFLGLRTNLTPQNSQKQKFIFSNNNPEIAHQIIQKVYLYLSYIKQKLPPPHQVNQIRTQIQKQINNINSAKDKKNIDIDKQTYERITKKLSQKTEDPFIKKFLQTQIVGMQILK